ncbi:MAG TPA: hypothetical protein VF884_02375 [Nitrososphaeraceae archaeon]
MLSDYRIPEMNGVPSMRQGSLDYKINSMSNVTEIYSAPFNITNPAATEHYHL